MEDAIRNVRNWWPYPHTHHSTRLPPIHDVETDVTDHSVVTSIRLQSTPWVASHLLLLLMMMIDWYLVRVVVVVMIVL